MLFIESIFRILKYTGSRILKKQNSQASMANLWFKILPLLVCKFAFTGAPGNGR